MPSSSTMDVSEPSCTSECTQQTQNACNMLRLVRISLTFFRFSKVNFFPPSSLPDQKAKRALTTAEGEAERKRTKQAATNQPQQPLAPPTQREKIAITPSSCEDHGTMQETTNRRVCKGRG